MSCILKVLSLLLYLSPRKFRRRQNKEKTSDGKVFSSNEEGNQEERGEGWGTSQT